jgi:pimeloyl-ACP methyl ester carboxylesterase
MPFVTIEDCDIYYDMADYTEPWLDKRDIIVMHHGLCRSSEVWFAWVPIVSPWFPVLRIDARGCGRSSKPGEDFEPSLEGFTRDLAQILDALDIRKVHFIGESFGGIVGLNFTKTYPGRVKSLVLCNTPCKVPESVSGKYALNFTDSASAILSLGVQKWCLRTIGYRLDEQLSTEAMKHWYAREMARTPSWFAAKWVSLLPGLDFTPYLSGIGCPTLLLTGGKSAISTHEQQEMMKSSMPNCELFVLPSVGHGVNVVAADQCAQATLRFLKTRF